MADNFLSSSDPPAKHKVTIFLASPGDVPDERDAVSGIVDRLNNSLAPSLGLELVLWRWESNVVPDWGTAQEVIFRQSPPANWDIFVGILWLRFGTETSQLEVIDGRSFGSGSVAEFNAAYRLRETAANKWPKLFVYRCTRGPEDVRHFDDFENIEQFRRITEFFEECKDGGVHPILVTNFASPSKFEDLLERHLRAALEEFARIVAETGERPTVQSTLAPLPDAVWETRSLFRFETEEERDQWIWTDTIGDCELRYLEAGGIRIHIPCGGHDLYPGTNLDAPRYLKPVESDFTATMRARCQPSNFTQGIGMLIWVDKENFWRTTLVRHSSGEPYSVQNLLLEGSTKGKFRNVGGVKYTDDRAWIRMDYRSGMIRATFSRTGRNWQTIGATSFKPTGTVWVGVVAIDEWNDDPFFGDVLEFSLAT